MISTRPVPVTMGSPLFRSLELDGFAVIEAWFPAGEQLARHTHDRPCVAVMLEGSFDLLRPFAGLLDRPSHRHHAGVAACAARLTRELDRPDDLAPFAAEAAVLEILVVLGRLALDDERTPPPWLLRAQELVHAGFREPLRIGAVAREVDVHPGHLARAFRRHFRMPLGSYVRKLRLEWVAAELLGTEESVASVALAAGFADQSHLTRAFKCHTGLTPQVYRRARSRQVSSVSSVSS